MSRSALMRSRLSTEALLSPSHGLHVLHQQVEGVLVVDHDLGTDDRRQRETVAQKSKGSVSTASGTRFCVEQSRSRGDSLALTLLLAASILHRGRS